MRFTINTKDLTNYDEVSKSNNLYLYVREIATRNGQTKVLDVNAKDISKPEQKEEYIDGIKKKIHQVGESVNLEMIVKLLENIHTLVKK